MFERNDADLLTVGTDKTDCGTRYTDDADLRIACPVGSRVEYFTVSEEDESQWDIANEPCQQDGTCVETLNLWNN